MVRLTEEVFELIKGRQSTKNWDSNFHTNSCGPATLPPRNTAIAFAAAAIRLLLDECTTAPHTHSLENNCTNM